LDYINCVAVDSQSNIYLVDAGADTIRKIDREGTVSTVAGVPHTHKSHVDGEASKSMFNWPCGIAVGKDDTIYVCDRDNSVVRKICGGQVTTIAGKSRDRGHKDGMAVDEFTAPQH